jgi:hypothetical protein
VSDFYDRIHLSSSSSGGSSSSSSSSNAGADSIAPPSSSTSSGATPAGAIGETGADTLVPQVITTTVSAFAQAFVREVPLPDTSDEWMESKNAKSAAFKKVVATYKSNIASHENDGAEEDDVPPGPGPGPDAEEAFKSDDDALMYTAGTTGPATSGSTLRGNKFSQFSLASNSSNNDWLDDDPTPAQKAASKNAYLRQFEKATTAYADESPPRSEVSKTGVLARTGTEQPVAVALPFSAACAVVKGHDAPLPLPPAPAVKHEPVVLKSERASISYNYYSAASPAASAVEVRSSTTLPPRGLAPGPAPASLLHILTPYGAGAIKPEPSAHAPLEHPRGGVAVAVHAQWSAAKSEATPAPPVQVTTPAAGVANYLPPDVQR